MNPETEQRLKRLAQERDDAYGTARAAAGELGRFIASRPAPMAEMASVLGVSRQAVYQLAEKWGSGQRLESDE